MFKYIRVQLNRSETTTFTLDVPPWEVAVLAAVNGEDRVVPIGETLVNKPLPSAAAEYDRLVSKYKVDTSNGQEYVAQVYGVGSRGIQALQSEIDKAKQAAKAPPVQSKEYDSGDDPLAGLFDEGSGEGAVEIAE